MREEERIRYNGQRERERDVGRNGESARKETGFIGFYYGRKVKYSLEKG